MSRKFEITNSFQNMDEFFSHKSKTVQNASFNFADKLLSSIEPIEEGGVNFNNSEINKNSYLEWPVREACLIFSQKNIKTLLSGGNKKNIFPNNPSHIIVDYETLSPNNKKIGLKIGRLAKDSGGNPDRWLVLEISGNEKTKAGEIRDQMVEWANSFLDQ